MNHVCESLKHTKWECKYHVAPAALFNRPFTGGCCNAKLPP